MSAARLRRKQSQAGTANRSSAGIVKRPPGAKATPLVEAVHPDDRLIGLSNLASVEIETALVANLSGELHALFDPVSDRVLPIYFGPLLGRLYLEGL